MIPEVLRGSDQIGGNLIQVTCSGTKILLDAGESLEGDTAIPPQAAWLTKSGGCDAVFLTHTHRDHMGLAEQATRTSPSTWAAGPGRYCGRPMTTWAEKR